MKTTLEIDDDLYREAKAVAALTGRKMKDLVADGLRWAIRPMENPTAASKSAASRLQDCFAAADKLMKKAAADTSSARDILDEERGRHNRQ